MSVYKRFNKDGSYSWWFTKTIKGVRYQKRIPTARTKAQAEEGERAFLGEVHDDTYGKKKAAPTFKKFVEEVFMEWTKNYKRSWRNDISRLKPLVAFFGRYRLDEITPFLIESYKHKRRKTPIVYKTFEKERSVTSVNREIQLLSRVFSLAISERKTKENPCDARNFPKGKNF